MARVPFIFASNNTLEGADPALMARFKIFDFTGIYYPEPEDSESINKNPYGDLLKHNKKGIKSTEWILEDPDIECVNPPKGHPKFKAPIVIGQKNKEQDQPQMLTIHEEQPTINQEAPVTPPESEFDYNISLDFDPALNFFDF